MVACEDTGKVDHELGGTDECTWHTEMYKVMSRPA